MSTLAVPLSLGVLLSLPGARSSAQQPVSLVRVRVEDSLHVPVTGADVSVLRNLNDVVASGTTDGRGVWSVSLPRDGREYQFVVRKVGYLRANQFLAPARDTIGLPMTLRRAPQTLETVKISEHEDLKRKSYHIDADDIANSTRLVLDGTDILSKLRPDMLSGRSGMCPLTNIWVNGEHIRFVPVNELAAARIPGMPQRTRLPPGYTEYGNSSGAKRQLKAQPLASVNRDAWYVLASIKPEHIEEANYVDCFDTSMDRAGQENALFVVLKPGIKYEPGVGSYAVHDSVTRREAATQLPRYAHDDSAAVLDASLVAKSYRNRIVGVFDAESGEALADVHVTDSTSGVWSATTATGTTSLAFLSEGSWTVSFTKPGYAELKETIVIAPANRQPLTIVLKRGK